MSESVPVVITGGGAVGLYLALQLCHSGISCRVIEQRESIHPHSRSLGIHPVSLESLHRIGLAGRFIEEGVCIMRGIARIGNRQIGEIRFEDAPPPWNFILALPQHRTESLLEAEIERLAPGTVRRGCRVTGFQEADGAVLLQIESETESETLRAKWLIGCDGKDSVIRQRTGIPCRGRTYPDTYMMGDFLDNTPFGNSAVVWLGPDGLVESFPMPDGKRRWVVKVRHYQNRTDADHLRRLIGSRTGIFPECVVQSSVSSFLTHFWLADRLAEGRVILAGDAAHVVSPIGGQGMNLGWIGAEMIARELKGILSGVLIESDGLNRYSKWMRRVARQAGRRAAFNMAMGRAYRLTAGREILLRLLLNTPLNPLMAKLFTMRGLGRWIV